MAWATSRLVFSISRWGRPRLRKLTQEALTQEALTQEALSDDIEAVGRTRADFAQSAADAQRAPPRPRRAGRPVAVPAAPRARRGAVGASWGEVDVPGCWTMQGCFDLPHYTNVQMPFAGRPPQPPDGNPTGALRARVRRAGRWATAAESSSTSGAAESVLIARVNGREVGISKDSHLAAEFDVTDVVRPGANTISLSVVKWSDATLRRGPGPVVARRHHPLGLPVRHRARPPRRRAGQRRPRRRPRGRGTLELRADVAFGGAASRARLDGRGAARATWRH